jgi:hypothetical protein
MRKKDSEGPVCEKGATARKWRDLAINCKSLTHKRGVSEIAKCLERHSRISWEEKQQRRQKNSGHGAPCNF